MTMSAPKQITLQGREYKLDEYGNLHQSVSYADYGTILEFYKEHLYFAGKFREKKYFEFPREHLALDISVELRKVDRYVLCLERVMGSLVRMGRVLELGCGTGALLYKLKSQGVAECEGWDLSTYASDASIELWKDAELRVSNYEILEHLQEISLSEIWDTVIAFDLIEHVRLDRSLLRGIKSLLKRGGELVVEIPIFNTSDIEVLSSAEYLYPEHHLHLYTLNGFVLVASECGWSVRQRKIEKGGKKGIFVLEVA